MQVPSSVQSYLAEPAVEDVPVRVWRDWALVAVASVSAVLETVLRTDAEWLNVSAPWRWASLVAFLVSMPPALLMRRTRPVLACALGFGVTLTIGTIIAVAEGELGGPMSSAVVLICLYALFRWGSGRDGIYGMVIAATAWIVGSLADPTMTVGDWIGGFVVLSITILLGLIVRYQRSAKTRAISEAQSLEREDLARELHDTVAHHVSAIAVQAQAGQALAASDPARALAVLGVIEEAASRTLIEMRAIVGTLRNGAEADLAPQRGLDDITRLASDVPGDIEVTVSVADGIGPVGAAAQSTLYRIAREALTNAGRHATDATAIDVEVSVVGDRMRLTIVDDGRSKHDPRGAGYGLLGMAERAEMLGGTLRAGPRPDGGWQVVAEIPRSAVGS